MKNNYSVGISNQQEPDFEEDLLKSKDSDVDLLEILKTDSYQHLMRKWMLNFLDDKTEEIYQNHKIKILKTRWVIFFAFISISLLFHGLIGRTIMYNDGFKLVNIILLVMNTIFLIVAYHIGYKDRCYKAKNVEAIIWICNSIQGFIIVASAGYYKRFLVLVMVLVILFQHTASHFSFKKTFLSSLGFIAIGLYFVDQETFPRFFYFSILCEIAGLYVSHTNEFLDRSGFIKNQKLSEVARKAMEASTAKEFFLATMSHEIRTPLNSIVGGAQILLSNLKLSQNKDLVHLLLESAEDLLDTVNEIIEFSLLKQSKAEFEKKNIDFCLFMDEIMLILAQQCNKKGLKFKFNITKSLPVTVVGDSGRIRQILLNLLENALKFTPKGTISVSVDTKTESFGPGMVKISISDTGVGIPYKQQKNIGSSFTQADHSYSRQFEGVGLGLSISKYLVEKMGGEIDFVSKPGEGTTFWVVLPLLTPNSGKVARKDPKWGLLNEMFMQTEFEGYNIEKKLVFDSRSDVKESTDNTENKQNYMVNNTTEIISQPNMVLKSISVESFDGSKAVYNIQDKQKDHHGIRSFFYDPENRVNEVVSTSNILNEYLKEFRENLGSDIIYCKDFGELNETLSEAVKNINKKQDTPLLKDASSELLSNSYPNSTKYIHNFVFVPFYEDLDKIIKLNDILHKHCNDFSLIIVRTSGCFNRNENRNSISETNYKRKKRRNTNNSSINSENSLSVAHLSRVFVSCDDINSPKTSIHEEDPSEKLLDSKKVLTCSTMQRKCSFEEKKEDEERNRSHDNDITLNDYNRNSLEARNAVPANNNGEDLSDSSDLRTVNSDENIGRKSFSEFSDLKVSSFQISNKQPNTNHLFRSSILDTPNISGERRNNLFAFDDLSLNNVDDDNLGCDYNESDYDKSNYKADNNDDDDIYDKDVRHDRVNRILNHMRQSDPQFLKKAIRTNRNNKFKLFMKTKYPSFNSPPYPISTSSSISTFNKSYNKQKKFCSPDASTASTSDNSNSEGSISLSERREQFNIFEMVLPISFDAMKTLADTILYSKYASGFSYLGMERERENVEDGKARKKDDKDVMRVNDVALRILIAEDNKVNQKIIQRMLRLESKNNKIFMVSDGKECISFFEKNDLDVILMDVHMPLLDGIEASRQIREMEKKKVRSSCSIFAVTASATVETKRDCFNAGMNGFLTKPIKTNVLHKILELSRKQICESGEQR